MQEQNAPGHHYIIEYSTNSEHSLLSPVVRWRW